jgi:hypothetical protein
MLIQAQVRHLSPDLTDGLIGSVVEYRLLSKRNAFGTIKLELLSLVIHKRAYRTGNMDPHVWPNGSDSAQYSHYNRRLPLFCYGLFDHSFLGDCYRDLHDLAF